MARQSSSGRESGSTATKNVPGNQTPNTPDINESEIARLKVDQLRDRLRRRGITGTADMRKSELVDALIRALREGRKTTRTRSGSGSRDSASPRGGTGSRSGSGSGRSANGSGPGRAATGSRSRGGSGSRGRNAGEQPGNQTPNTPEVNESEIARLKVDQLRDRLRRRGITGTADMRKDELVEALIRALREGRKTTRSRSGATAGGGSTGGSGARRRSSGGEQPGNQTPNTPEVNESEFARLKVDELRYLLRRRGVTDTSTMRKDELVEALVTALRTDRPDAGAERPAAIPMPAAPQARPSAPEAGRSAPHAELEAAPAPAALPVAPTHPERDGAPELAGRSKARIPRPRTAPDDIEEASHRQPVRSSGSADGEPTGSGPSVTAETADRVLTELVPAEMEPVDEVVTPEGTVITGGAEQHQAVATPPLPGTTPHDGTPSPDPR